MAPSLKLVFVALVGNVAGIRTSVSPVVSGILRSMLEQTVDKFNSEAMDFKRSQELQKKRIKIQQSVKDYQGDAAESTKRLVWEAEMYEKDQNNRAHMAFTLLNAIQEFDPEFPKKTDEHDEISKGILGDLKKIKEAFPAAAVGAKGISFMQKLDAGRFVREELPALKSEFQHLIGGVV